MARLVIYYLLLSVVTVGLVDYIAFIQAKEALQASVFERLNAVATLKADELNRWVNDQLRDVLFVAGLPIVQTQGEILLQQPAGSPAHQAAYQTLSENLSKIIAQKPGLQEIFILDLDGTVIISTNLSHVGQSQVDENYFQRGQNLIFLASSYIQNVYISPTTNRPAMTIIVPFFNQAGQRLGLLAAHLYLERMNRIILNRTGLGQTGETYLIDSAYQFVSEARFRTQLFEFPQGVHTPGIDAALQKQDGAGLYLNYQGAPVMGVYRWLPDRDMALLAEMQEAEAFAPARALAQTIWLIGLTSAVVLGLGVYLLARQITRPILSITRTAAQVAAGNLTATVPELTGDEVGLLARTFNQMTGQLHSLYAHLEEVVKDRTHRLELVATLGERFNAILDLDLLLSEIVNQFKQNFGYYHAQIFLLDESGQNLVLAAATGMAGHQPKSSDTTIPLYTEVSLMARAARTGEIVNVPDVRLSDDWLATPLLPHTASEIVVPIIIGESVAGVLDVQEDKPASFDESAVTLFRSMANQIAIALNNARLFSHLQQTNQKLQNLNIRLQDELNLARQIQQSLLPPPNPNWLGLDMLCYSRPAHEVGGDLYAYHAFDASPNTTFRYVIAIGDVSGKGMPAALLMAVSIASFHSIIPSDLPPASILANLDRTMLPYTRTSRQNCALCYLEIIPPAVQPNPSALLSRTNGGALRAANAGCIYPIIRRQDGSIEWVRVGGPPLGFGLGAADGYAEAEYALSAGDLVILTSDGVVEAKNSRGEMFGFERWEQTIRSGPPRNAEAMLTYLKTQVTIFVGNIEPHDDMTIVVAQV
ncbi:MAG: SpoIIE family protein phosphatase [Anaerolineae bacterium]